MNRWSQFQTLCAVRTYKRRWARQPNYSCASVDSVAVTLGYVLDRSPRQLKPISHRRHGLQYIYSTDSTDPTFKPIRALVGMTTVPRRRVEE